MASLAVRMVGELTIEYRCPCGITWERDIIAYTNPPIPWDAWPDDRWQCDDVVADHGCPRCGGRLPQLPNLYRHDRYTLPKDRRPK